MPRRLPTALLVATLAVLALPLAGCGDYWDYDGNVIVDNRTDGGATPEDALSFRLARFGDPFTGNLLGAPLPPGSAEHLGEWHEDYYDAEAEMDIGPLVEWFDVWIFADEDNFFDIY
jgi:hypothetical protein